MLPKYITILDKHIPQINQWKKPTFQAVNYILEMIDHEPTNAKIIAKHLPFLDQIFALIDSPTLYNHVEKTLSSPEITLIDTAVRLLVDLKNDPTINVNGR